MKDTSGIFGIEVPQSVVDGIRMIPAQDMDEFLQRCKVAECLKIASAQDEEDRFKVQCRQEFVDQLKKFFKSLLTKPQ